LTTYLTNFFDWHVQIVSVKLTVFLFKTFEKLMITETALRECNPG